MNRLRRQRKDLLLVCTLGVGVLLRPEALLGAEPSEPYRGVRETTLRYIALGTPDDPLRLREALDKAEQEIARAKLEIPSEKQEEFAQNQKRLKNLKDRLADSKALEQLLDSSYREIPDRELDRLSAQQRAALRSEVLARITDLTASINGLEKAIRFEQAESLRILVEERNALARLLAVRREQLLAEYAKLPECRVADRSCLNRKLTTLCRLKPLFSQTERAPLLHLIREVDSQLNVSSQTATAVCEYLQYDFGP